jgi:hypothetical protein
VPAVLLGVAVKADVLVLVAGGVLATLLGVVIGAVLARRAQIAQWSRDRQVEACVSILRASTRAQVDLLRRYRGEAGRLDWAPWNEAMAVIQLVGHRDMATEVTKMDELFWRCNDRIEHGEVTNPEAWVAIRDTIEAARLKFANVARNRLAVSSEPLSRVSWRPPEAAWTEHQASGVEQPKGSPRYRFPRGAGRR